jgi:hypothetical protein
VHPITSWIIFIAELPLY